MSPRESRELALAERRAKDKDLADYVASQVAAAMDRYIGTTMTESAIRAIRITLDNIVKDIDRAVRLPFTFSEEVYAHLRVDGTSVHVTWLPRTQRAAALMWDLQHASLPDAGERPQRFFDSLGRELPDALPPKR